MRQILILLFVSFTLTAYSIESIDSSRYIHAKNSPSNVTIEQLVKYLKKGAKGDKKVVETFFYWIAQNIQYDRVLKNKIDVSPADILIDSVLIKKKTICSGYSNLLYEMCNLGKIECIIINGIAQNYLDKQIDRTNHAWNAVKIDNKWLFVDATWGSGGYILGSGDYDKRMEIQYLFADPNFLIIDHFPEDKKWQLLYKPITIKQFHSEAWKEKRFRKFNNLLDDNEYKNYKQIMKKADHF